VVVNPSNGLVASSATITGGTGGICNSPQGEGTTISCTLQTLPACASTVSCSTYATVAVSVTAATNATNIANPTIGAITVNANASANGGTTLPTNKSQTVSVSDFAISASPVNPGATVNAGSPITIEVQFSAANASTGYSGTITPSDTISPSMVTSPSPTFSPTSLTMSGSGVQTTYLTIPTVARPVTTGSLFRRGSFYAAWLPIGGLSLIGSGIGAGRKRRRWLAGLALVVMAGAILLQPACGGSSTSTPTTGGTSHGSYLVTIKGTAGAGSVHSAQVTVYVN
jgi:hypothetical protein